MLNLMKVRPGGFVVPCRDWLTGMTNLTVAFLNSSKAPYSRNYIILLYYTYEIIFMYVLYYCVRWKLSGTVSQFRSLSRFSTVNPFSDVLLHIIWSLRPMWALRNIFLAKSKRPHFSVTAVCCCKTHAHKPRHVRHFGSRSYSHP